MSDFPLHLKILVISLPLLGFGIMQLLLRMPPLSRLNPQRAFERLLNAFFGFAVLIALGYLLAPRLSDKIEVAISVVGLAWMNGQPLYHAFNSPDVYSFLYGPFTFVVNGLVGYASGGSDWVSKWIGTLPTLLGCFLILSIAEQGLGRKLESVMKRQIFFGLFGFLLCFGHVVISNRGDGFLFFFVCLSLYLSLRSFRWWHVLVLGLCVGLAGAMKITSIYYFLPIAFYWLAERRFLGVVLTGLIAAMVQFAFFIPENISWEHYWGLLDLAREHGLALYSFYWLFVWTLLAVIPWWGVFTNPIRPLSRAQRFWLVGLGLSVIALFLTGSKGGAGRHHLIPLLPQGVLLCAWLAARSAEIRIDYKRWISILVVLLCFMVVMAREVLQPAYGDFKGTRKSELKALAQQYGDEGIHFGFGERDTSGYPRNVFVLEGQELFFEINYVADLVFTHHQIAEATFQKLESCHFKRWVFPKGEEPFSNPKYFEPDFQRRFLGAYRWESSSDSFDIYVCKK